MLNQESIQAVQEATFDQIFCKPLYENYCFARIPATLKRLLIGPTQDFQGLPNSALIDQEHYECLIVILVDGFGWRFLKNYLEELPFLQRFLTQGIVSKLTSQFPSTTAAHLTCLHTGLPVGQTGVYEWFYYEPLANAIVAPLPFSFAGDPANSLLQSGIKPENLFPFPTIYQDLKSFGIPSTLFYHRSYALSPFSQITGKGATIIPYASCAEGIFRLADLLSHKPRGYFYFYFGEIDSASHRYGPDSPEVDTLIRESFALLEKRLGNHPVLKNPKTALIITADHGLISTSPSKTIYLNHLCPELLEWMKKDFKGHPLAPAGSPRDYFLYIKEPFLEEAYQLLKLRLEGKANIYRIQTLIENGIFGPQPPSSRFFERTRKSRRSSS